MSKRIKVITGIFIILMLSAAVSISYAQNPEDEALKKGVDLVRHDRFDEAITEFNKVIAADPKSASAYYNLGFAYDKKGDLEKAILNFTKAIEMDIALTDAYYNRGFAYYKKGVFDKAIADYNKVIEISPVSADAYYGLGLVYSQKGDLDKAISEYGQAIKARPGFALAYDARAVAYVTKKNYLAALADVNKAQTLGFRSRPLKGVSTDPGSAEKEPLKASNNRSGQGSPTQALALTVAGIIFLALGIMQLIRVMRKVKIVVNDRIVIPLWLSMIASPVMLMLAIYMFIAARQ